MFQILPMKKEELPELLGQAGELYGFKLINDNELQGQCIFEATFFEARILAFTYPQQDKALADGLIRTVLAFCIRKNIMTADFTKVKNIAFFSEYGFIKNTEDCHLNIIDIFKNCDECGK